MFNLARHFQHALQPLCQRALDLDTATRVAWLNELRADCPTVARELERLIHPMLDACASSQATDTMCPVVPGSPEYLGLRC